MWKSISIAAICLSCTMLLPAQVISYPYPLKYFSVNIEGQRSQMAFMDILPEKTNGQSVILFHGKNFNGFYWKDVIQSLTGAGYRVIVPDQVGFGKSSKPTVKYTFDMLTKNNSLLLDSLQIDKVNVIGHSMGGMLAARFALSYPGKTAKLLLEDPLGLEDYKKFVPYSTMEEQFKRELSSTYASIKKYQESYYPTWKPEYEIYVQAQAEALQQKDFRVVAWVNALTYQMIYEQPVLYDFPKLAMPTLIIVGTEDRTFIGKAQVKKEEQKLHGNFPVLATRAKGKIKNCRVIEMPGVGHIPHIQEPAAFNKHMIDFLQQP